MKQVHEFPAATYDQKAADFLAHTLNGLLEEREMLHVALSGGSTPIPILEMLQKKALDWTRIRFFLVDERCVPRTSSDSNYRNLANALFNGVPSDSFGMYEEDRGIKGSVSDYAAYIKKYVSQNAHGMPVFDLMVLGMGNDGHTASLFPGTEGLKEEEQWVIGNYVPQMETQRITLTYPVLLNATKLVVLAKGTQKRKLFEELYAGATEYPMQRIVDQRKDLVWIWQQ